jgi:glycosyltransferase involved in cell wall biosynthesis
MKRVFVLVSNDLATDNRVNRTCLTLKEMGYEVILIGRLQRLSLTLNTRPYSCVRLKLYFEKGALFYAALNIRIFIYLLFNRFDGVYINDLDTLLAGFLACKLKRVKPIIYDSHELFTETPELINRAKVRFIWLFLEKRIVPKLKYFITVNESIGAIFREQYNVKPTIIRNVPQSLPVHFNAQSKDQLGLPNDKKIVIIQGSGMNKDRGIEEAISAMQFVPNAILILVGGGDVIESAKKLVDNLKLNDKVLFFGKRPYLELMSFTHHADIGLAVDKAITKNYELALPNKLFDYIHASTPIICSSLPEIVHIVKKYNVGMVIESTTPQAISEAINKLLGNEDALLEMKKNCIQAAKAENWENEKKKLERVIFESFDDSGK